MAIRATWDIEMAKDCQLPKLIPDICERCEMNAYCHRQLTLFDCADGERSSDWIRNPKYPHGELRDHLIDEMIDKEERNGIQ